MPPIRLENPFRDPTENLRSEVNPFLDKLKCGLKDGSLPLIYGESLRPWRGKWRDVFSCPGEKPTPKRELILEIGSHKGEVLKSMAQENPDSGFLGIDITFKRVVSLAEKAKANNLSNIKSLLCNAKAIDQLFAPDELDGVIIFFPDPWTRKKRQQKNRLLNEDFIKRLATCIKPGGWLWIKTDHKPYFEQIAEHMTHGGFETCKLSEHRIPSQVYPSRFEMYFKDQNIETYEKIATRKADSIDIMLNHHQLN